MIKINLLKPGIAIYNDSNPGGIIDIKFKTNYMINPCLYEVFWDKEDFNNKIAFIKKLKIAGKRGSQAGKKLRKIVKSNEFIKESS